MPIAGKEVSEGHSLPSREEAATLPRDCTFARSDWLALAPFWYPVAFSALR